MSDMSDARIAILGAKLSPKQNHEIPPLKYDYVYNLKRDFPKLSSTSTPPKWSENAPLEPRVIKCLALLHPSSLHPSHFSSLPFMSPLSPSHLQARRPCSGSRGHSPLELSTLHKGARARKQSAGPH